MQDLYQNLPGHVVELRDTKAKLKNDPVAATTDAVLFLGTATDGPLMDPVPVNPDNVEAIFGKAVYANGVPTGATLVQAFEEAWNAGCRDIRLMRVTGVAAVATLIAPAVTQTVSNVADKTLGVVGGNQATTSVFTLGKLDGTADNAGNTLVAGSVKVMANNVLLSSDKYTIAGDNTAVDKPVTVTLKDGVCDSEATVIIEYTFNDGTDNTVRTEGGDLIAHGVAQKFVLDYTPKSKNDMALYAAGGLLAPEAFSIALNVETSKWELTFKPGYASVGAKLEVKYLYEETTSVTPSIELESVYAGGIYNETKVQVSDITDSNDAVIGKEVRIVKPESKKLTVGEVPLSYRSIDYPTFDLMVRAINSDPYNNVVKASTLTPSTSSGVLSNKPLTLFSQGADELDLDKNEMFKRLGGVKDSDGYITKMGAYQLLENYETDFVVPLGVFADDALLGLYDNFAYQLALACAIMSHRSKTTIGMIGVNSTNDTRLAAVEAYVQKLEANALDFLMKDRFGAVILDSDGNAIDLGRFIQVVAGPDLVLTGTRLGLYAVNGVCSYAGYVSSIKPQSSPTNKEQAYVEGLRYEMSNAQLDRLTGARYVTFKTKSNGTRVAIVDAPTCAQPGSDYSLLTSIRCVKEATDQIREACDAFIGEPNEANQRNAMSAAISKRLDKLRSLGVIQGFDFHIIASIQDQLLGQAQIELTVIAPQTLRKLTTVVTLKVTR